MTQEKWGGDGLGPEDMAIPEIKLIQNVGGDTAKEAGAQPGDFYCSLTDETIKGDVGFAMVIVAMQKNRTYWGRDDIGEEPPLCASMNAASMKSMDGEDCSVCPHRNETPWLLSPTERRTKCLVNYNVLGVNLDNDLPILIRTTGISAQAAKELYTQLSLHRKLAGSWYKAKAQVTSVKKKSSAGDAFAIRFGKLELVETKLHEELEIRSKQLLGTPIALPVGREELLEEPEPMAVAESTPTAEFPEAGVEKEKPPPEEKPIDMSF